MTAPMKKLSPSVDYTSRDYAALREELIARMSERVPEWAGNDPADFGLALVESFAYMGDLVNYYIDRVANESYILTATQRQSILNLASMYGYYPKGYVSATCDVTFKNNYGFSSDVGGRIINADGTASVIINSAHPFVVGDAVIISGCVEPQYNGTWNITSLTEATLDPTETAHNVISFVPTFDITGYSLTQSGSGGTSQTTVTFDCVNTFVAGQSVQVSGVFTSGTSPYVKINKTWTIVSATATTFTVQTATGSSNVITETYVSGGIVKYAALAINATASGRATQFGNSLIPAGTQLSVDVAYKDTVESVVFSTTDDILVPYQGSITKQLTQGEDVSYRAENAADPLIVGDVAGELLGRSDGSPEQYYPLSLDRVDTSLLQVYVEGTNAYSLWKQVDHIADWGPNATVYSAVTDADGIVYVVFGDGVAGAVPPQDAKIKAVYFSGGGEIGNIDAGLLTYFDYLPNTTVEEAGFLRSTIGITSAAARGGADPESDDSIRYNAPRTLRVQNRAVTKRDFADLALSVAGVGKAVADADVWSSVTVYIAPSQSDTSGETAPVPTSTLLQSVSDFLADKVQIGTTVTVASPVYTPVHVTLLYKLNENYSEVQVKRALHDAIVTGLSYNKVDFGQTFTPGYIEYLCRFVDGVDNIRVTSLYREGGSGLNTLIGEPNEIFVFTQGNTTLTAASNVSTLSSLTLSNLTISPAATGTLPLNYTASVANTVANTVIVPTATNSAATISVNNQAVLSGDSISIGLDTGLNLIRVVVTAGDGSTSTTYTVAVTKDA